MIILGIGGILGDAAAAVLKDGVLVAAVEQRKLARRLRPGDLPDEAIGMALKLAGAGPEQVDSVALVRPIAVGPEAALHLSVRGRFPNARVVLVDHHMAHAASAFYPSPFEEATVLTLDRAGDYRCGARWRASGNQLTLEQEQYYPDSLGDLYRRVTELAGFDPEADPHKLQWLSATGGAELEPLFEEILGIDGEGWPRIDRGFFDADRLSHGGFAARMYERLGIPDESPVPDSLKPALAAGVQRAIERAVLGMAGSGENLCLAGGLMLNALLVSRVECSPNWRNVFVQPAAGNARSA